MAALDDTFLLRTRADVFYAGVNITDEISDDLLEISFTDNDGDNLDDLSLTLKNEHGKWSKEWLPTFGDSISVNIVQEGRGAGDDLQCGVFTIDQVDFSGPPARVQIRALSLPFDAGIVRQQRTKAWQKIKLSSICKQVAATAKLKPLYLANHDPTYDRRDQRDESDMTFLKRLCDDEAYKLKISNKQLVVFSPKQQDATTPVFNVTAGSDNVKSFSFSMQNHDLYSTVIIEYKDPAAGKINAYTYTNDAIKEGKTFRFKTRTTGLAEAQRKAQAKLFNLNRKAGTGQIELVGDTRLVAGVTVSISGFGAFDGKYYVSKATHTLSTGYTTSIELDNTQGGEETGDIKYVKAAPAKRKKKSAEGDGYLYKTVSDMEATYNKTGGKGPAK